MIKKYPYIVIAFLFFCLAFIIYHLTGEGGATPYHYFVPLADAFLHGRLFVLEKPTWLNELLPVGDKYCVIYPPMPAILLMPFVAIWGLKTNQTLVSVFWGSINVALFYLLMRKLLSDRKLQVWMTLLFGFGTIHWYLASIGKAWFFSHVTSFFFLTLAVYETLSARRLFLIGLLLGASFWCRLPTIISLPFFVIMLSDLWLKNFKARSWLEKIDFFPLLKLGAGLGIFILLNFLYNYMRFGTILDVAYAVQAGKEPWYYPKGLFDISYIPKHLFIFFLKGPVFSPKPPYVMPSLVGMSVLLTTPVFIYSVFAGIKNKIVLASWSAILPIALVEFTHGGVGWVQFGYRFALDFYPFLLILTAMGIRATSPVEGGMAWHHKLLIILSLAVNLWGVLWINKFGWSNLWG